jgi:hypothetical protein
LLFDRPDVDLLNRPGVDFFHILINYFSKSLKDLKDVKSSDQEKHLTDFTTFTNQRPDGRGSSQVNVRTVVVRVKINVRTAKINVRTVVEQVKVNVRTAEDLVKL